MKVGSGVPGAWSGATVDYVGVEGIEELAAHGLEREWVNGPASKHRKRPINSCAFQDSVARVARTWPLCRCERVSKTRKYSLFTTTSSLQLSTSLNMEMEGMYERMMDRARGARQGGAEASVPDKCVPNSLHPHGLTLALVAKSSTSLHSPC